MSIQDCDYSAYAVILAPNGDETFLVSLYHWRHFDCAEDPTGVQLLHEHDIKPYKGRTNAIDQSWAATQLAPALAVICPMVSKSTTVPVCLWENTPIQNCDLRLEIQNCCQDFPCDPRGVAFQLVERPGPFEKCSPSPKPSSDLPSKKSLTHPESEPAPATFSNTYLAIYTVKPKNVLRIYQGSGRNFSLLQEKCFQDQVDITESEAELKQSVIYWVASSLHPALDLHPSSNVKINLYLPTEDLCANRNNEYNSVRDQIMAQLAVTHIKNTTIVLAGSSDPESPNGILDPIFDDIEHKFQTLVKYLVTMEYGLDFMDIVLERWDGCKGEILGKPITIHVVEADATFEENINAALGKAITTRNEEGGKNAIPLVLLLLANNEADKAGEPVNARIRAIRRETMRVLARSRARMEVQVVQKTAVRDRGGSGGGGEACASFVYTVLPRYVVVVDAGSGGTRAVLYRWQTYDSGSITVCNRPVDKPFRHPWLPYIKFVGQVEVNQAGIHTLANQDAVQNYLAPLNEDLNILLQQANVMKHHTPMFMLGTGGMRSIGQGLHADLEAGIRDSPFFVGFENPQYDLATGPQEALFGWITANYSLGRLEPPALNTYGFVEMGGQSVQIAYEIPMPVVPAELVGPVGPGLPVVELKNLVINWGNNMRVFPVFTKMFPNLGTRAARDRYFQNIVGPEDRCSLAGHAFDVIDPPLAIVGTSLSGPDDPLEPDLLVDVNLVRQARAPGAPANLDQDIRDAIEDDQLGRVALAMANHNRLAESLLLVFPLLGCVNGGCTPAARCGVDCQANLLLGNPPIDFAAGNVRFVGGASFWYAAKAIFRKVLRQEHSFTVTNIRDMIIQFAMQPVPAGIIPNNHALHALFNALLVYTTLYDGFRLPPGTTGPAAGDVPGISSFHPFNGVVGQDVEHSTKITPYSWTLGRALYFAVNAAGA